MGSTTLTRNIRHSLRAQLNEFSDEECLYAARLWQLWARGGQMPPAGDWRVWMILAGRGYGKTRTGAEWVRQRVMAGAGRIGLIAPTRDDARDIMVDGESGLMAVCSPADTTVHGAFLGRPVFTPTRRRVDWENGATAMLFSAEEPERLRGPQHDTLWADELAAWRHGRETWDMAMFGLRLGDEPRACVTTTPKPVALVRDLMEDRRTAMTRGTTFDNAANLPPAFLEAICAKYEGTPLGRQELMAELISERETALWTRERLEACRQAPDGALRRVVVAVDPPASAKATSDACGIIVAGVDAKGDGYVIADHTVKAAKPDAWAARAVAAYHAAEADAIIAEVNQGGDMVTSVIRTVDPTVPVKPVRATRGKWTRAEPVAALYAQRRVFHAAHFVALEDEMCDFGPDGLSTGRSPDRLDAMVWALSALMLTRPGEPRLTQFR